MIIYFLKDNVGCDDMVLPKIKFKEMTLKENIDLIKWAYYEDNGSLDVHNYTIEYYPELASIEPGTSRKKVYKIIEDVVKRDYEKYKTRIEEECIRYSRVWEKYNNKYFETLTKYLDIKWIDNKDEIIATVGLIPVFPRYLDKCSFSVSTGLSEEKIIEVCAHETLHFWWFLKWQEIHPEIPKREYDSPYLTWQYSEMVTDSILNNNPFSDIFNFIEKGYDSFYELKDHEGKKVMDVLRNIYAENIAIEDKINKGFEYVKEILG